MAQGLLLVGLVSGVENRFYRKGALSALLVVEVTNKYHPPLPSSYFLYLIPAFGVYRSHL